MRRLALYTFVGLVWAAVVCLYGCQAFTTPAGANTKNTKIVEGYWTNWRLYKNYPIKGNTNLQKQLHVVNTLTYAFLFIDKSGRVVPSDPWGDIKLGSLKTFSNTPVKNHWLSVGGAGGAKMWLKALNNPTNFVGSIRKYIQLYKINGLDLDYEPAGGIKSANLSKYIRLIQKLKSTYPNLTIQICIHSNHSYINRYGAANWAALIKVVDYVNVMAYEMYGPGWSPTTMLHSPLAGPPEYTAISALKALNANGVPNSKIILGIGAFGVAYKNSKGCGLGFKYTGGTTLYYKDVVALNLPVINVTSNSYISGSYSCQGSTVITFDDPISLKSKLKYVNDSALAGVAVWELSLDVPMSDSKSLVRTIGEYL